VISSIESHQKGILSRALEGKTKIEKIAAPKAADLSPSKLKALKLCSTSSPEATRVKTSFSLIDFNEKNSVLNNEKNSVLKYFDMGHTLLYKAQDVTFYQSWEIFSLTNDVRQTNINVIAWIQLPSTGITLYAVMFEMNGIPQISSVTALGETPLQQREKSIVMINAYVQASGTTMTTMSTSPCLRHYVTSFLAEKMDRIVEHVCQLQLDNLNVQGFAALR
jgi:hypothetical protein